MTNCIVFFNPHGFGDTFFSSPFIRHICDINPTRTFYYFIIKGEYVFTDKPSPNLHNFTQRVLRNDIKELQRTFSTVRAFQHQRYYNYTVGDTTFIFFNMWCEAMMCQDLIIDGLVNGFARSLQMINRDYSETYNDSMTPDDKIMPIVSIQDSRLYVENGFTKWLTEWRQQAKTGGRDGSFDRKLVFIFNYVLITVKDPPYNIDDYIISNARRFEHTHTFLVPRHRPAFENISNIVCCDKLFQYSEIEKSYKNVFILDAMIRECDIIISQYCGGSWIWFNEHILHHYKNHNKPVYLTHPQRVNDYTDKMNRWIKRYYQAIYKDSPERLNEYKNFVEFVEVDQLPAILMN